MHFHNHFPLLLITNVNVNVLIHNENHLKKIYLLKWQKNYHLTSTICFFFHSLSPILFEWLQKRRSFSSYKLYEPIFCLFLLLFHYSRFISHKFLLHNPHAKIEITAVSYLMNIQWVSKIREVIKLNKLMSL